MTYSFLKFVKSADIFGKNVQLRVNQQKQHKTVLGSLLTILIIVAMIATYSNLFEDFIEHRNPTIVSFLEPAKISKISLLNESNFFFAVQIPISSEHLQIERLFEIVMYQVTERRNKSGSITYFSKTALLTQPCNLEVYQKKLQESLTYNFQNDYSNKKLICLSPQQQVFLQGNQQMEEAQYLSIEVVLCNNSTATKCYESSKIRDLIYQNQITFQYTDILIMPQQYETPYHQIDKLITRRLDLSLIQKISLEIQDALIQTDQGWFFKDYYDQIMQMVGQINNDVQHQYINDNTLQKNMEESEDSPKLIEIYLQKSSYSMVYQRKYIKIYTLFGILGGLIKILVLVCSICISPLEELAFQMAIANKIFDFNSDIPDKSTLEGGEPDKQATMIQPSKKYSSIEQSFIAKQLEEQSANQSPQFQMQRVQSIEKQIQIRRVTQQQSNVSIPKKKSEDMMLVKERQDTPAIIKSYENIQKTSSQNQKLPSLSNNQEIKEEIINQQSQPTKHEVPPESPRRDKQSKTIIINKVLNNYAQNQEGNIEEEDIQQIRKVTQSPINKKYTLKQLLAKLFTKEKSLILHFTDYLQYYFGCFRKLMFFKNKQYLQVSFDTINERTDLHYILNKLVEIDKLKMLLLDCDQIRLFEYLPKPIINVNNQSQMDLQTRNENTQEAWSFLQGQKTLAEKAGEAYKAFLNLQKKQSLSDIDNKLIEMIDKKFKYYFSTTQKRHENNKSIQQLQLELFQSRKQLNQSSSSIGEAGGGGSGSNREIPDEEKNYEFKVNQSDLRQFNIFDKQLTHKKSSSQKENSEQISLQVQ